MNYNQSLTWERVGKTFDERSVSVRKVNDKLQSTWLAAIPLMSRVRGYLTGYRQVGKNSRTEVSVEKK